MEGAFLNWYNFSHFISWFYFSFDFKDLQQKITLILLFEKFIVGLALEFLSLVLKCLCLLCFQVMINQEWG